MSLPCTAWITEDDLASCGMCSTGGLPTGQAGQIITTATQILYLLSGQQFPGLCTDVVRPCNCSDCSGLPIPVHFPSGWRNVCGGCGGYCGTSGAAILLPKRPVLSVTEVLIDGEVFLDRRLDSPGWLVRTDGGTWPTCQDITEASTEAGTWQVSYIYGKNPPEALQFAAMILSSELVKACVGDATCRIPAGAVTVQRQGITYDFNVASGKTGLYEVDQILSAFNPGGIKRRARLYSPDEITWARTT